MWLTSSSIGRKLIMAITGISLILFVTFHVLMNAVALIWPTAYNQVCEFLGANWYALIASAGLAALFIIHIIYALWLTFQNRAARGNDRYAIDGKAPGVEWSSKNMLVLGIVVVAFLVVHLIQFWAKMQLQEMCHTDVCSLPQLDGSACSPAFGTLFIEMAFKEIYTPIIYIIGFVALWFHMNHGFWSMFQTIGWNNNVWIERFKKIGCWWSSIVVALFIAQAIVFTIQANNNYYTENEALQEQYAEFWGKQGDAVLKDFQTSLNKYMESVRPGEGELPDQSAMMNRQREFIEKELPSFVERAQAVVDGFKNQCSNIAPTQQISEIERFVMQMNQQIDMVNRMKGSVTNPTVQQPQ